MPIEVLQDGRLSIASIVFATDLSPASRNAGLYAAARARHFGAELTVIRAFILSQSAREAEPLGQIDSGERRQLVKQLQGTSASLLPAGGRVRVHLLDGEPSEKIPAFADGISHSMLVPRHSWCLQRRTAPHRRCGREVSSPRGVPNS
jgi:nucleotide-binding universal stress UspA family protein